MLGLRPLSKWILEIILLQSIDHVVVWGWVIFPILVSMYTHRSCLVSAKCKFDSLERFCWNGVGCRPWNIFIMLGEIGFISKSQSSTPCAHSASYLTIIKLSWAITLSWFAEPFCFWESVLLLRIGPIDLIMNHLRIKLLGSSEELHWTRESWLTTVNLFNCLEWTLGCRF